MPGESTIFRADVAAEQPSKVREKIEKADGRVPSKPTKPPAEKIPSMSLGVRLVRWEPKPAPVLLTTASLVTDVDTFIADTLAQLDRALRSKQGATAQRKVRELVDRLEQCGVVVRIAGIGSASGARQ